MMNLEKFHNKKESEGLNGFRETELPLIPIDKIETGQAASFFVYHGSDRPFINAVPSEKFPVVFYAEKPSVAATYPWGKYLNALAKKSEELSYRDDVLIGAKILFTEKLNKNPLPGPQLVSQMSLQNYHFKDPKVISVQERLSNDSNFRAEADNLLASWEARWDAERVKVMEIEDFETGPVGSVREYLVTSKNPVVFDFEGHTWGDLPDETVPGGWLKPTQWATTEDLRVGWNEWIDNFFEKGYDVVVIKNIRDVGANLNDTEPHMTIAASRKAGVEPRLK